MLSLKVTGDTLMCLGVPGKVVDIYEAEGIRMGKVDFGGIVKEACLVYVPEVKLGDYTIIHVGFAIAILDEASAQETLALFQQMGILEEELNPEAAEAKMAESEQNRADSEGSGPA